MDEMVTVTPSLSSHPASCLPPPPSRQGVRQIRDQRMAPCV